MILALFVVGCQTAKTTEITTKTTTTESPDLSAVDDVSEELDVIDQELGTGIEEDIGEIDLSDW